MLRQMSWCVACVCLLVLGAADTPRADGGTSWLDRLNYYRATATLPPVVEEPSLSGAVMQHARYVVDNDVLGHSQNVGKHWATAEGAAAAAASNLAASTNPNEPDWWAVDLWMQAPFHALGILDPALTRVGFGIHRANNGKIQTAAGLDVIRGRSAAASPVRYPIVWPADGATVPLTSHLAEDPSPLTSCRGYTAPTGLPLIVQLGNGERQPAVIGSVISDGDEFVEHCVFDESTYTNRNASQQALARRILDARDAVILVPRKPLRPGAKYRVIIEVDRRRIDWTFAIAQSQ